MRSGTSALTLSGRGSTRLETFGIYAMMLACGLGQTIIVPILPTIRDREGIGAGTAALLLTIHGVTFLLAPSLLGPLLKRVGYRHAIVGSGALVALSIAAQAHTTIEVLFLARGVFGLAIGVTWTACPARLTEMHPTGSGRRMAGVVTASALGTIVGPAFSGAVSGVGDPALPFVLTGGLAALVVCTMVAAPGATPLMGANASEHHGVPHIAGGHRTIDVLRRPTVLAAAAGFALSGTASAVHAFLIPAQLHNQGFSERDIGLVLSVGAALYLVANGVFIVFSPRITNLRANAWLAVFIGVSLVPAALGSGVVWLSVALLLSAVPRAAIAATGYALAVMDTDPRDAGTVIGIANAASMVPATFLPMLAGMGSDTDVRPAYLAFATLFSAVGLWLLFLVQRKPSLSALPARRLASVASIRPARSLVRSLRQS